MISRWLAVSALAGTACTAHVGLSVSGRSRVARDLGIVTRASCELDELLARVGPGCAVLSGKVETAAGLDAVSAGAAFDRDVCRSWNGGPNGDGRWIGLDLGEERQVDTVLLVARHGGRATHVVDVSTDGATFSTAMVLTGEIAMDQAWAIRLEASLPARWVRVTTTAGGGAVEGPLADPDRPDASPSWREVALLDCTP